MAHSSHSRFSDSKRKRRLQKQRKQYRQTGACPCCGLIFIKDSAEVKYERQMPQMS